MVITGMVVTGFGNLYAKNDVNQSMVLMVIACLAINCPKVEKLSVNFCFGMVVLSMFVRNMYFQTALQCFFASQGSMISLSNIERVMGVYPESNDWAQRQYLRYETFSQGIETISKMFAAFWFLWILYLDQPQNVANSIVILLILLQFLVFGYGEFLDHPSYDIES